ncbi:MAG: hypothetical protein ABWY00_07975 [Dongiaceae bacterium]
MAKKRTGRWRVHAIGLSVAIETAVLAAGLTAFGGAARAEPAAGDSEGTVKLFVNVMGNGLADKLSPPDSSSLITPAANEPTKQVELGSVPLTVAAQDSSDQGVVAGANGQYVIVLSDRLSLVNSGSFSRTQYLSGTALAATAADGGPELLYKGDGLTMGLRPDLGLALDNTALDQVSYGVNSHVSKDLFAGLNATATTGYALQNAPTGDSRITSGSAGLSYLFPANVKMDVNYVFQHADATGTATGGDKQGPTISATVPVGADVNIGARYCYTRTDDDTQIDHIGGEAHTIGLTADWDIGAPIDADVKLRASYDFTRDTAISAGQRETQQAGTVGMAMKF